MKHRHRYRWLFAPFAFLAAATALAGGCGTDNGVVGGTCANGYTDCDNHCVNLLTDPQNCGTCGHACPPGAACTNGVCAGSLDATLDVVADTSTSDTSTDTSPADGTTSDGTTGDGAPGDGSPTDGTTGDGPTGDGAATDGGPTDSGLPPDVVCMPPYNNNFYCGNCNTQCVAPNPDCAPVDGGYACVPVCPPPLIECNDTCVDPTSDPFNCNGCGNFCPTFICVNSKCVGSTAGSMVLIGHDYFTKIPANTPQAKVLENAVFERNVMQTRVLSYERYAANKAINDVNAIITAGGNAAITHTNTDGDIPSMLTTANFEVLLVHDQPNAPANTLGPLGTSWQATLTTYLQGGGVVIVLDSAGATDMPLFVTNAQLLNLTAQTRLPNTTQVVNTAPGDIVGNGVASPYRVTANSSRFACDAPSSSITYVIYDQTDMQPVVVHRTY
jgi:hypothetical protein